MISFKSIAIQFMASSWAIRLTGGASLLAANALRTLLRQTCAAYKVTNQVTSDDRLKYGEICHD